VLALILLTCGSAARTASSLSTRNMVKVFAPERYIAIARARHDDGHITGNIESRSGR